MTKSLLEIWQAPGEQNDATLARLQQMRQEKPWFCLPYMLQADMSEDALDHMRASYYAPNKSIFQERAQRIRMQQPANKRHNDQPTASALGFMAFRPPTTTAPLKASGTGPLDIRVQRIVARNLFLIRDIQHALSPKEESAQVEEAHSPQAPQLAVMEPLVHPSDQTDSNEPPIEQLPLLQEPQNKKSGLFYETGAGKRILIQVSDPALLEMLTPLPTQPITESASADPVPEFKLRDTEELRKTAASPNIAESVAQKEAPVSATMAKLLAMQGDTQGAIEMYEKLCLANPDNSAIFEAQIKKLAKNL